MNRRRILTRGSALLLACACPPCLATRDSMHRAMAGFATGVPIQSGKVVLSLPEIVENGNSVPVTVYVPSPMTQADHVRRIAVFTEKNPAPEVIEVRFGPAAGRAEYSFRMRLADSQTIAAVAELSDGSVWSASVEVVVALAACLE